MIDIKVDSIHYKKELLHAQSLINLITRMRNRVIFLYHKLIYDTAACLFLYPTVVHCFQAVLYKLATDLEGNFENSTLEYIEDPPYLKLKSEDKISEEGVSLLNELFNFIIELKSYKTILKQIDKETPGLLYLICEKKEKISPSNISNIKKGIELFQSMITLRSDIINMYKYQIREFITQKENFIKKVNQIGEKAFKAKITDIYEIIYLLREYIKEDDYENRMYHSIRGGKQNIERIISQETNDDIIASHESIIIEQKDEL